LNTDLSREDRFEERLLTAILDDFDQLTAPAAQNSRKREEALQPCFQQPRAVVRRPALELRPAGCLTAFHGEQAHADRGAPGQVKLR